MHASHLAQDPNRAFSFGRRGRRRFIVATAGALLVLAGCDRGKPVPTAAAPAALPTSETPPKVSISELTPGEDVVGYVTRKRGKFDHDFYKAVIGSANEYKEGDESLGLSADTPATRAHARTLIANTQGRRPGRPADVERCGLRADRADHRPAALERVRGWKMARAEDLPADPARGADQGGDGRACRATSSASSSS